MRSASERHLSFHDHVHQFDSSQKDPGTAKVLNPSMGRVRRLIARWSCSTRLLRYFDWRILMGVSRLGIDRFERGEIGAAFVDGHRLGRAILGDRFLKVTPSCSLVSMGAQ